MLFPPGVPNMPYFSRLTEIVTCNLTALLDGAENRQATLEEIIKEIQDGVTGAKRSARTAENNVTRIECEISEQLIQSGEWMTKARDFLEKDREDLARNALSRKKEVENLIAGLEQQLNAAVSTRDHLKTTLHALEARLADAQRRRTSAPAGEAQLPYREETILIASHTESIEAELAALRREVRGS
jgi:phage shock protein A